MTHPIAELLPFYANGTLDVRERALVDAELATCASCSAELTELRTLEAVLQARAASQSAPVDALVARALSSIDTPALLSAAPTRQRVHWWNAPLRYAASIVLVACASAGAVAAWHAHEAGVAHDGAAATSDMVSLGSATTIYRVSPRPLAAPAALQGGSTVPLVERRAVLVIDVRDGAAATAAAQRIVAAAAGTMRIVNALPPISYDPARPQAPSDPRPVDALIVVPAAHFAPLLTRIGAVGSVATRSESSDDRSAAIAADSARLRDAREARARLVAGCADDSKDCRSAALARALADVSTLIAQLAQREAADEQRTVSATVHLTLRPRTASVFHTATSGQ